MIPIYFIDRILYLSHKIINNSAINHQFNSIEQLTELINDFDSNRSLNGIFIIHSNLDELLQHVLQCFKVVEAAGGLVFNDSGEILVMKRRGMWDLPKGKLEKGEGKESGAIREVQEECGITKLELHSFLITTYHTYREKGKFIIKPTYWYKMHASSNEQLCPQAEEDITEVLWANEKVIADIYLNTYPSIKEVLEKRRD